MSEESDPGKPSSSTRCLFSKRERWPPCEDSRKDLVSPSGRHHYHCHGEGNKGFLSSSFLKSRPLPPHSPSREDEDSFFASPLCSFCSRLHPYKRRGHVPPPPAVTPTSSRSLLSPCSFQSSPLKRRRRPSCDQGEDSSFSCACGSLLPMEENRGQKRESCDMSTEVHGFVSWIASIAVLSFCFLWALLPHKYFHRLSITYLLDPYWAIAFPVIVLICLVAAFFLYTAINLMLTVPLDSYRLLPDKTDISKVPERLKAQLHQAALISSVSAARFASQQSLDAQGEKSVFMVDSSSASLPCPPRQKIPVSDIHVLPLGAVNRIMFPLFPSPNSFSR
ncbi:pig-p protein [Cystoisospora suis]|uniref:Pig-p protein n=1 Tax=Cystoisospora suis TaxID=483139 RepID=A0A2C6K424_9APIC|nr:pig-p protein [Cystoisospora suis]